MAAVDFSGCVSAQAQALAAADAAMYARKRGRKEGVVV
jgi:hypothetical protein